MIARGSHSVLSLLQVRNIYECFLCMLVLHYFPFSSFLGLQHQDKSKESAWYWIMVLASDIATWIQGPLGKDAIEISYPAMGHRKKWMEKRTYKAIVFRFELFLEKRVGPNHWREAFCLFSLIWAFVSCATSRFTRLFQNLR